MGDVVVLSTPTFVSIMHVGSALVRGSIVYNALIVLSLIACDSIHTLLTLH